ncbi:hypothetical protein ACFW5V_28710 [Streptomyces sp. NPDC058762]|uniref:hypothetical protein n=1 Tax=Streptomyces sp. NPDC058762 TaxID=3346629 RepID=UPI003698119D
MTVGHNGINVIRNGRAEWEPNPCALPHYDYPESTCTETAGHTGPHAAPLIINGRERGAVAWDEPKEAR